MIIRAATGQCQLFDITPNSSLPFYATFEAQKANVERTLCVFDVNGPAHFRGSGEH